MGPSSSMMLDSSQVVMLLQVNTLGVSILAESLRSAAFFIKNTNHLVDSNHYSRTWVYEYKSHMKDGRESLAFINGTGLEIMLDSFYLDFDAEKIRKGFFYIMRKDNHDA